MPPLRDPDRLVYFREEVGGLLMGGYERHPAPWGLDGIPADFADSIPATVHQEPLYDPRSEKVKA